LSALANLTYFAARASKKALFRGETGPAVETRKIGEITFVLGHFP
jgi:hypothetical protein